MTQVFSAIAMDTPALTPGWTVQNAALGGSDQNLVANAGAGVNSGTAIGYTPAAAQTATGEASFTAAGSLPATAKLSDLQNVAASVDALNAALASAGLEV